MEGAEGNVWIYEEGWSNLYKL